MSTTTLTYGLNLSIVAMPNDMFFLFSEGKNDAMAESVEAAEAVEKKQRGRRKNNEDSVKWGKQDKFTSIDLAHTVEHKSFFCSTPKLRRILQNG